MKQSTESMASIGKDPSFVQEKNSSLMDIHQKLPEVCKEMYLNFFISLDMIDMSLLRGHNY